MKVMLLLGSNSDVGQAAAHRFAKEGFRLLLASRNVDDYQKKLAKDIEIRHKVQAEPVYFDAAKFAEHSDFYESLPVKPDVVVSVFGYLGDHELAKTSFEEAHAILTANLTGNISLLNLVANDMEARQAGTIVCVSSVAGERGRASNYYYGAAKAGLTAFLSGLRNRLCSSGVHVATIIPGFIRTRMIEGLKTPGPLTASAEQVGDSIWNAYRRKKNVTFVVAPWWLVMAVIRSIPEFIFKKLSL